MKSFTSYYKSPIGIIKIISDRNSITYLGFCDETLSENDGINPEIIKKCIKQLAEYFAGNRQIFDLDLNINGTEFQKKIWRELEKIPFGQTKSYKDLAKLSGNDKASRAVGAANSKNPISIIIPCHRVIASDGKLSGYAGGVHRKKWLLEFEKRVLNSL